MERGIALRMDSDAAPWARLSEGKIRVCARCYAGICNCSAGKYGVWRGVQSAGVEVEFCRKRKDRAVPGAKRGNAIYLSRRSYQHQHSELYLGGGIRDTYSRSALQLERGAALHAHFER